MRLLTKCQANLMQAVLLKIDRRSKPIKKQEKIVNDNLKKKAIFLDEENFDILTLLQKKQTVEKKPVSPVSFQEPMNIVKSKPLKSEKDRLLSQREKSGMDKRVCKEIKDIQPKIVSDLPPKLIPQLAIVFNKTEIIKVEKPLEYKPKSVMPVSIKSKPEDDVMTEKTVEQTNLNLNIQPQTSSDMYPNFYGSHMGHT